MEDYFMGYDAWYCLAGGIVLMAVQAILPKVLKENLPVKKIRCIMALLGTAGILKFAVEWRIYLREQKRIIEGK